MRDERGRAKALQAPFFFVGHKRNWNVSPDFLGGVLAHRNKHNFKNK